ncbi:putative peptidase family-domain-containing protein [Halenospora varia]|nr:putative peptidase family-domain-containing protein [Halenospora varia]
MLGSTVLLFSNLLFANAIPTHQPGLPLQKRETPWVWNAGGLSEYEIHISCNSTESAQLRRALNESITLAQHAKDHILRFGNSSEVFVKYFGNNTTTAEPAGWYDKIINGDKNGVLFRCDDIDNKCYQDGWAGHWRGDIAPDQTVICPLSFESRWPLEAMCGHGYTVASGKDAQWFGADLLHRLYHTQKIAEGTVDHYADTQEEILSLAIQSPGEAVRNSATLRHFAVEVYAYDIAVPGEGCSGTLTVSSAVSASPTVSQSSTPAATMQGEVTTSAFQVASVSATTVKSATTECHTHGTGEVHCS